MSKFHLVGSSIVLAMASLLAVNLHAEETEGIVWHTNPDQAWKEMREQGRPLLMFITTDECQFCTRMKSLTYSDAKVKSEIGGKFVALRLNADHDLSDDFLERFGIEYFPTTLLFAPNLKVLDRVDGYVDAKEMSPLLTKVAKRSDEIRTAEAPQAKAKTTR